jgi:hypothetical protein
MLINPFLFPEKLAMVATVWKRRSQSYRVKEFSEFSYD